jgi:hypothetical protein
MRQSERQLCIGDLKAHTQAGVTRPHSDKEAKDALEMCNSIRKDKQARAMNISTDEDIPIAKFHLLNLRK